MRNILDRLIELFKWPVALYMLISLPAFVQSLSYFQFTKLPYIALIAGFFMFFISRSMLDSSVRVNMEIIAHEMTHAFFALLTFHKVKSIRVEGDNSGGAMSFEGDGNWLIIIAPYFFSLFGLFYMVAVSIYTSFAQSNLIINGIMGYFIGYHLDTVGSQIHEKQTDLPKVSYLFCALFLPSANLLMIGSMLAFNSRGWNGVWIYSKLIAYLNSKNINFAYSWLESLF
ncbi:MAG: M50 family metallopeptidase [Alphaproteobacteria bacterium]|nr:M50 family metallopeptidase [Alphaproteobacteria bacterium]